MIARTTGVASTKFLGSCLRISLGVADLAASITSDYCTATNSSSEFCQTWKEYEFYINMGLLTASVSDMLYTKLSNSYTQDVKAQLSKSNPEAVKFIEDDLGITTRTGDNVVQGAGSLTNVFFKNVDEFALTFDKAGAVSQTIRNQAFDLYKQGKWSELETLFKNNNLNGKWPPANGGYNIIDDVDLKAGMKFDRYGGAVGNYNGTGTPNLGGSFTSPMSNGNAYSFGQRALNQAENGYDFYYEIEILNDLPFKGQTADVIPWFNQVGGGKQTMWKIPIDPVTGYPKTWNKLAQEGHVKITIKSSPSGKYNNLAGTVIK